nr:hypothetical protein [Candidatus Sigynarchaeota archaeon]
MNLMKERADYARFSPWMKFSFVDETSLQVLYWHNSNSLLKTNQFRSLISSLWYFLEPLMKAPQIPKPFRSL